MESIIWTEENGYQLIETDDDGNVIGFRLRRNAKGCSRRWH
jgi:hypothetical protein